MESPAISKPSKDKTLAFVTYLLLSLMPEPIAPSPSPHIVGTSNWTLTVAGTDVTLSASSKTGHNNIGCPSEMKVDLRTLFQAVGNPVRGVAADWYACPGKPAYQRCSRSTAAQYYCDSWGCETSSWGSLAAKWNTPRGRDPLLITYWDSEPYPHGPYIKLTFTECSDIPPAVAGSWGIRHYDPTGPDLGAIITLSYKFTPSAPSQSVGPNKALKDQQPPARQATPAPPVSNSTRNLNLTSPPPQIPGSGNRLFDLVQGAYLALNLTYPNKTKECWLCLQSSPPYYEGIAISGNYSNHTSPPTQCSNIPQHKLTLSEVSGAGLCLGTIPPSHKPLCNTTLNLPPGKYYLVPLNDNYWACSTGLTPCVSSSILNVTSDFCVLVELWPKIGYHDPEYIYHHFEQRPRMKREPVSLTLAILLGGLTAGGITAGIGTGATALAATQQFRHLQKAMHTDIKALEEAVSALEKSLTSLSEVVLQNRRGLDILFLQEGGLCAALREECCFYADHTGLVRDSMAKLRERLNQRQQLFESELGWFEEMFNTSPWLTTLISSIVGPLLLLLLVLILGPCILNRLVQFIKSRLSVIQTMVLTHQYHQLQQIDPETTRTESAE